MTEIEELLEAQIESCKFCSGRPDIYSKILSKFQDLEKNLAKSTKAWKERRDVAKDTLETKEGFLSAESQWMKSKGEILILEKKIAELETKLEKYEKKLK